MVTLPKIVRWRLYLQSFKFQLRHIKGRDNQVADQLSRLFCTETAELHARLASFACVLHLPVNLLPERACTMARTWIQSSLWERTA